MWISRSEYKKLVEEKAKAEQETERLKTCLQSIQLLAGKEVSISTVDVIYRDLIQIYNITVQALGGYKIPESRFVDGESKHDDSKTTEGPEGKPEAD